MNDPISRAVASGASGGAAPPPTINSFYASPTKTYSNNNSFTLYWSTTNATSASISPSPGSVSTNGSTGMTQSGGTTYTLTATNANGSTTASTYVDHCPYPDNWGWC